MNYQLDSDDDEPRTPVPLSDAEAGGTAAESELARQRTYNQCVKDAAVAAFPRQAFQCTPEGVHTRAGDSLSGASLATPKRSRFTGFRRFLYDHSPCRPGTSLSHLLHSSFFRHQQSKTRQHQLVWDRPRVRGWMLRLQPLGCALAAGAAIDAAIDALINVA